MDALIPVTVTPPPSYTGSSVQHAPVLHALLRAKDGAVAVAAEQSLLSPLPAADRGPALHPQPARLPAFRQPEETGEKKKKKHGTGLI